MNAAIRLDDYAFLLLEGARVKPFLQGQLTCNVQESDPATAMPGAYCTPKGRVICSFMLWEQSPDSVVLRMRADLLEETGAVLGKYAALSRVRVSNADLVCFGLLGAGLQQAVGAALGNWPARSREICANAQCAVVRRDEGGERFELWVPRASADAVWEAITARLPGANANDWRLALVRAGSAEIQQRTADQFLPQMLGYDRSQAVSFRKGCYTGQEIIARTHYKGSVKRNLQRLGGTTGACPAVGSDIFLRESGRAAGTVVESARCDGERYELLAVVADDALAHGDSTLQTELGAALDLLSIPCIMP